MGRRVRRAAERDLSIVLAGAAGQGIQTIEQTLAAVLASAGYRVFSTKEYMSRVRGGCNSTSIRVSARPVAAPVSRVDVLVALSAGALEHMAERIGPQTLIAGERAVVGGGERVHDVPFGAMAAQAGGKLYANTAAVGAVLGLLGADLAALDRYLERRFLAKGPEVVAANRKAGRAGYERGAALSAPDLPRPVARPAGGRLLTSGADAVTLGAIAGGCNFIASYPMSPSTPVLTGLAQRSREFGIAVEQAEDEVAAINMALGAWYAGGRAMVTTSGGGFALMTEGVSLAACTETPVVIHLAQRPGPATGLPTRTEQGDLNLALYAGHGEFPRAIYAPGTLEQGFAYAARAFETADRWQVPAFVLTDQYFVDTYYDVEALPVPSRAPDNHVVRTAGGYRRYALTRDGVSERGVPGYGEGIVAVDSDEHTEEGYITESRHVRRAMMHKRLARLSRLRAEALRPTRVGPASATTVAVCWGSTYHAVREALERLGRNDIAMLHFGQVYPFNPGVVRQLAAARKLVAIEGNATGQFARLLRAELGVDIDAAIRKYDGHPFTVEEVAGALERHAAGTRGKRGKR